MPELSASSMMFALAALMVVVGLVGLVPSFLRYASGRNATLRAEMAAAEADVNRIHTYLEDPADDTNEQPTLAAAPETPVAVTEVPATVADAVEAQPAAEEPVAEEPAEEESESADEDDMMALFRETKVKSGLGEVLQDSIETVSIAELLAEARSLRELIAPLVPDNRP